MAVPLRRCSSGANAGTTLVAYQGWMPRPRCQHQVSLPTSASADSMGAAQRPLGLPGTVGLDEEAPAGAPGVPGAEPQGCIISDQYP